MVKPAQRNPDFRKLEQQIQSFWEERGIYRRSGEGKKKTFYFLDGPPYASGSIHLGTAWNKIIKDAVLRYLSMRGYRVHRMPGWDCHGLPIEVKVEREMGIRDKREIEGNVEAFVEACRRWALRHVDIMTRQFRRLGVWMDWEEPYMTLRDEYIESAWWTIKRAHEKGLLTRDLRVVTWCPRCETALADAEVEYGERTDPSIYLRFRVRGREDEYLLVWTTTPWTLIANLAVAVHPEFEYARVRTPLGVLVVAREQLGLLERLGIEGEVVEVLTGRELEGLEYLHPLEGDLGYELPENSCRVILADFVTLGEGTGLVHCAPGHGPEDFEVAKRYGIPAICPVDERGRFTEQAGKFAGLRVKKDDARIIEELESRGVLVRAEKITHRYGHCWRCKSPIIYRATEQWFITVSHLRDRMLEEVERVEWVPEWAGSSRFREWVAGAKDWTISRQRYWGIPLPVWLCDSCGDMEVMGSKAELEQRAGRVRELHRPYVDVAYPCECGGEKRRVEDVLDVWFDSGVAPWASLGYPAREEPFRTLYPVDFITEGHDQTRGWFYSLLGCGLIAFDEVPYRKVLMHGFTLDERGEKMSKSRGNVIEPEEVVNAFCADVLRFYVLWANKPWEDLRFSWSEVRVVAKMFNILWNAHVFATTYMSLDSFAPKGVRGESLKPEDRWMLSRVNSLVRRVGEAFERLELHRATRELQEFILEDLSRWYIPLVRPRTWYEEESPEKLAAYEVLHRTLQTLAKLLAPVAPHLSEAMYQDLECGESVHLESFPEAEEEWVDERLEAQMRMVRGMVDACLAARQRLGVKRRWPLVKLVVLPEREEVGEAAEALEELLLSQCNALELEVLSPGEEVREAEIVAVPEMGAIGREFRKQAPEVARALEEADAEALSREMESRGWAEVQLGDGNRVRVRREHVRFERRLPESMACEEFEGGRVCIDARRTERVMELGLAREVVRRVQEMRKELELEVDAYITTRISAPSEQLPYLRAQQEYIARETRSRELVIAEEAQHFGHVREWSIDGSRVVISVAEA